MTPRWAVLLVEVPERLEDDLSHALAEESLGVEVVPAGAGRSRLAVYFAASNSRSIPLERARETLRSFGIDPDEGGLRVEPIEDGRWVERYQETLRPIPLGSRFLVVPGRDSGVEPGRVSLRVVPGMAFGTGEHPTTRLCAEALERVVTPGSAWLDLGTGSGILAMICRSCAARRVLALDIDPVAIEVAREGAAANGMDGPVEFRTGSLEAAEGETFDGVVANITLPFFLENASTLARGLRAGGLLIASGFVVSDLPEIAGALAAPIWTIVETSEAPPWACILAVRHGTHAT